eukprot:jgi/Tetstr1/430945/TSEL_020701.t1
MRETQRHVVFGEKTWDEQWVPTYGYGKHAVLRDSSGRVPLGTIVWQSRTPLRPNIREGHYAFHVALKHIEEKL